MTATLSTVPEAGLERRPPDRPPPPDTLAETGLSEEFLIQLLLRILYTRGARPGQEVSETIALPFALIDDLIMTLQQRRLVEVRGTHGPNRQAYIFDLTTDGRERAREAMMSSHYAGPAPVPLPHYREWAERQSIANAKVRRADIEAAFQDVVLPPDTIEALGPAVNSGKSIFLFGDSGNGKTMIAEKLAGLLGGEIFVPYAVEVDGQIMAIYDPAYHRAVLDDGPEVTSLLHRREAGFDRRYTRVHRPMVVMGGELTLDQLDLRYDSFTKLYQAPSQVKANGGVLIIDDFGRQRIPPRELLNRWILPLEKRIDYLTLHTGSKFSVPFDCLLIFATNLDPDDLVEEAFLRRIHYKLYVDSPTREQYAAIFERCCEVRDIVYDPAAISRMYDRVYQQARIRPRACHPRDVLDHVLDVARFRDVPPTLAPELLDPACRAYFLETSAESPTHV